MELSYPHSIILKYVFLLPPRKLRQSRNPTGPYLKRLAHALTGGRVLLDAHQPEHDRSLRPVLDQQPLVCAPRNAPPRQPVLQAGDIRVQHLERAAPLLPQGRPQAARAAASAARCQRAVDQNGRLCADRPQRRPTSIHTFMHPCIRASMHVCMYAYA